MRVKFESTCSNQFTACVSFAAIKLLDGTRSARFDNETTLGSSNGSLLKVLYTEVEFCDGKRVILWDGKKRHTVSETEVEQAAKSGC